MKAERWRQVDELLEAALERVASERSHFLKQACEGDEELRREVESLLAAHLKAGSFIEDSPAEELNHFFDRDQFQSIVGQTLGHYKILSLLGTGGMGRVYRARDTTLGREVAIKVLPAAFTHDAERVQRFKREARAASSLNHPNIITIYEIAQVGRTHFIAAELVEGRTLRREMSDGPMKLSMALDVTTQVASALAAAHAAGIAHRDIKPENIMRRPDGLVKVLDFGLAKLIEQQAPPTGDDAFTVEASETIPGIVLGTVGYMSPEQVRAEKIDARTDIFSLGVVLFELLSGRQPFRGKSAVEVMNAILKEDSQELTQPNRESRGSREQISPALERVVRRCLEKRPEARFQSASDLGFALKALSDGSGARATSPWGAAFRINQHRRGGVIVLAILAIVAVAGFLYLRRAPVLTEKDSVLIAVFDNATGDAVFDDSLRQALAVQLEQSPFLNIFPDERVRETLRYMNRSQDERVTRDVAREICERQGIKAMLAGSITPLGSYYVINLEATNAHTGDVIARQQVEAESKEQVLQTLGKAATKLREKLGESLNSIEKHDAPINQATTSSLDALKAFSLGQQRARANNTLEAISFFKRAIELDPDFAAAYISLAVNYFNSNQPELSYQSAAKAFELRDRVSEREKLVIIARYYFLGVGDIFKAIEAYEMLKQTYPRDGGTYNNLGLLYVQIGQYGKALENYDEAVRINPRAVIDRASVASTLMCLNRFDEAEEVLNQALADKLDGEFLRGILYDLAFIKGDTETMRQQIEWSRAKGNERTAFRREADTALFMGQLRAARELRRRASVLAERNGSKEAAARNAVQDAFRDAWFGDCQRAMKTTADTHPRMISDPDLTQATTMALCGEVTKAQVLADEMAKHRPNATFVNAIYIPVVRAAIEIHRGNSAQAIRLLESARPWEGGQAAGHRSSYLRGLAYLQLRAGAEAITEFQRILDHRFVIWSDGYLYPFAQLGLARAAALTSDTAKSRKAYEDFFELWKDADTDIPILKQARGEYVKLR